jgi:hypothetical protein
VRLDRADGYAEPPGDLAVGVADRDEPQDIQLTDRELSAATAGLPTGALRARRVETPDPRGTKPLPRARPSAAGSRRRDVAVALFSII